MKKKKDTSATTERKLMMQADKAAVDSKRKEIAQDLLRAAEINRAKKKNRK